MADLTITLKFEGSQGSGKSVLMSLIKAMLVANNIRFHAIEEPEHVMTINMQSFIRNK